MTDLIILSVLCLGLAISCLVLVLKIRKLKKSPPPRLTRTAEQVLNDLTNGVALVRIERVAPEDIFLRSPRDL